MEDIPEDRVVRFLATELRDRHVEMSALAKERDAALAEARRHERAKDEAEASERAAVNALVEERERFEKERVVLTVIRDEKVPSGESCSIEEAYRQQLRRCGELVNERDAAVKRAEYEDARREQLVNETAEALGARRGTQSWSEPLADLAKRVVNERDAARAKLEEAEKRAESWKKAAQSRHEQYSESQRRVFTLEAQLRAAPPFNDREGFVCFGPYMLSWDAMDGRAAVVLVESKADALHVLAEGYGADLRAALLNLVRAAPPTGGAIDIVFDGPPGPESGRFVEVENEKRESIRFGEWVERDDGYWALRIVPVAPTSGSVEACAREIAQEFILTVAGRADPAASQATYRQVAAIIRKHFPPAAAVVLPEREKLARDIRAARLGFSASPGAEWNPEPDYMDLLQADAAIRAFREANSNVVRSVTAEDVEACWRGTLNHYGSLNHAETAAALNARLGLPAAATQKGGRVDG